MAFETIRGEAGVDFIGTDNVDALLILNESGAITADGMGGADFITVSDSDNVVGTATIRGGAGADTITFDSNGAGTDARLVNGSVNGGAGNDDITIVGAVSSVIRGNEDDDDFTLSGNYTDVTVNGNSGSDSFANAGNLSLSNAKILGGNDNDGAMAFDGPGILTAVDSTINGGKGNDGITIGDVTIATNFTVFGGQGDDLITSSNTGSDNVIYSGDLGNDNINTGGAADSILGGEGDDTVAAGDDADTIDGGAGDDTLDGAAGADLISGGAGDDQITGGTGDDTITGGAGADSYITRNNDSDEYVITAISDSAATTASNDTVTFDTFSRFRAGNIVDITAITQSLTGDRVSDAAVAVVSAAANNVATADQFSEIAAAVAGNLTASSTDSVQVITFTVDAGELQGDYFVVNDTNTNLSAADLMFQVTTGGVNNVTAASFDVV